jgi:hypothetical protein
MQPLTYAYIIQVISTQINDFYMEVFFDENVQIDF